tara:strand:- start:232 stop:927 length:696 start_codon:yes stop_codon:yes gene_type:complete
MKKVKLLLLSIYIIIIISVFFFIIKKFGFDYIIKFKWVDDYTYLIKELKSYNKILLMLLFFFIGNLWVFFLGFASPLVIISTILFDFHTAIILSLITLSTGATLVYVVVKVNFLDTVQKKYLNMKNKIGILFSKNQLVSMIIFRAIGGIPFQLQNFLPGLFNINYKNYFIGTIIGLTPQVFFLGSLANGINKGITSNLSTLDLLSREEIYLPILGLLILLIVGLLVRKIIR